MQITHQNNFMRVFELPDQYPAGFCFGEGKPVNFQMVDWFNPYYEPIGINEKVDLIFEEEIELEERLIEFLKVKNYVKPGKKYLAIADYGQAFIFTS